METKDNNYLYNYKELNADHDLKWYDYGARFYDAVIGRWHVVDPMGERTSSWSPYNYVENNALVKHDPSGMYSESMNNFDLAAGFSKRISGDDLTLRSTEKGWVSDSDNSDWIPTSKGDLVAEKGDNAKTMAKNYGYTEKEASKMIKDSKAKLDKDGNVVEGQKVKVSNEITDAIKGQRLTSEGYLINGSISNCHGFSCSQGGFMFENGMDRELLNSFEPVDIKNIIPRETVFRWGGVVLSRTFGSNLAVHTATYYGRSSNGTIYVATVNGYTNSAVIQSLNQVINEYNNAKIQGVMPNTSGIYNFKH